MTSLVPVNSDSVVVDVYRPDLFACAFKNGSNLIILVLNVNDYPIEISLVIENESCQDMVAEHSIVSYSYELKNA